MPLTTTEQLQGLNKESGKIDPEQTNSENSETNTSAPEILTGNVTHFLVKISNLLFLRDHISASIKQNFPDCKVEPLLLWEEKMPVGDYLVITFSTPVAPWKTAAQMEGVDGVIEAEPDLPRYTSLTGYEENASTEQNGSLLPPKSNGGMNDWNEPEFLNQWAGSPY